MAAAKRDVSGTFDAELKRSARRKCNTAALDSVSYLSRQGVTFVSETCMPEWTEVSVEMRMPVQGARKDQSINCHGVVVQCERRQNGKGFMVALIFLYVPKHYQTMLEVLPVALSHSRMSSVC